MINKLLFKNMSYKQETKMRKQVQVLLSFVTIIILCSSLFAQEKPKNISFATESGLGIQFNGEIEMEFVDVEGAGGFSNQDLSFQKVKTRSPHMRIDKAILEVVGGDSLGFPYLQCRRVERARPGAPDPQSCFLV